MPGRRSQRRKLMNRFYLNGALWGLGNGLVSSALIVYLATSYGVQRGFYTSLIIAAPRFVGVLRLGTPLWIARVGNTQRFCVASFLAASAILLLLPVATVPGTLPSVRMSLITLVTLWTLYHLAEYFGIVSLWAWIGQAVPGAIRGRFIGRRLAFLNACQVVSMVLSGWGNIEWREYCNEAGRPDDYWYGYVFCISLGALLLACAVWPLAKAPAFAIKPATARVSVAIRSIFAPYADRAYWRFLIYGAWFSLSNGLPYTATLLYRIQILNIPYGVHLAMDGTSQGVQSAVMPWAGKSLDRWGGVPVLTISQILVALSMVFFLLATPEARWWIVGAYVMWIAYAGVNTAMPKLMLAFSPKGQYAAYSAAWFAWLELIYGMTTLVGGLLYDSMKENFAPISIGSWEIDHFAALFLLGLFLRLTAGLWASLIREPQQVGSAS